MNEQAEIVCADPFLGDLVVFEAHDADRPYLNRTSGRGPSQVSTRIGASVAEPQDDSVAGNNQVLDVNMEVRERLVVAADRFGSGRRACAEPIVVLLAVEVSGRFVISAIPDLLNEPRTCISLSEAFMFRPFSN